MAFGHMVYHTVFRMAFGNNRRVHLLLALQLVLLLLLMVLVVYRSCNDRLLHLLLLM